MGYKDTTGEIAESYTLLFRVPKIDNSKVLALEGENSESYTSAFVQFNLITTIAVKNSLLGRSCMYVIDFHRI